MTAQMDCLRRKHDLFRATHPVLSVDCTRVYVICWCGKSRELRAEDWETIQAAKSRLTRTHAAVETQEVSHE